MLSHNALASLPETVGALPLRALDVSHNALAALPDALGGCAPTLEVRARRRRERAPFRRAPFDARASRRAAAQALDVSHNRIGSLAPLAPCRELVTLACDGNLLEDLDGLDFATLGRLTSLSCGRNALGALPDEIGLASKLEALSISGSRVESLPATLPGCKLKDVASTAARSRTTRRRSTSSRAT